MSAAAKVRSTARQAEIRADAPRMTEIGNGQRFARKYGHELRYVHTWRAWLHWDGTRWKRDEIGIELVRAKSIVSDLYEEAGDLARRAAGGEGCGDLAKAMMSFAKSSSKASSLRSTALLAQSETPVAATADAFDRDPMLLNVLNGTLDLRTGELRPHRQIDTITMLAPAVYDAHATTPTFNAFLERVVPDEDVRSYLHRLVGYALTGSVTEQTMPFFYGEGANGKSTFTGAVQEILGDYAAQGSPGLLIAQERGGDDVGRRERARLRGKRLVLCQEVAANQYLNEVQVKQLTGGDKITAARLYENEIEFSPTHKIIVAANHKPRVRGQDHAIWRRIALVPFTVCIPDAERDPDLPAKLRAESSGILAWAVRGCLEWQRVGLNPPAAVRAATADYREDEDRLAEFLEQRTESAAGGAVASADLYERYTRWCSVREERPWSREAFAGGLVERGFKLERRHLGGTRARCVVGLKIKGLP